MNAPHEPPLQLHWAERNQRWLTQALAALSERLEAAGPQAAPPEPAASPDFEPALDRCAALFGLSPFERELLLLAAGVELDERLRHAVTRAQARTNEASRLTQPSFALALSTLVQPHWDALSPQAPLRRWRLVALEGRRTPVQQPLHVDERVLHFLMGVAAIDERLLGLARLVEPQRADDVAFAQRVAQALTSPLDGRPALAVLSQERPDAEALVAAARGVLAALGCPALWLQARDLPADAAALADIALLLDREAALSGALLVIELDGLAAHAGEHAVELDQRGLALLAHLLRPVLLLGAVEPAKLSRLTGRRTARLTVPEAPPASSDPALARALRQFRLPAATLRGVVEQLVGEPAAKRPALAWQLCREAARGGLDALAQRVDSQARFDDLVLPPAPAQLLREIAEHLNHRDTVYEDWGLGGRSTRGRGLCVLFAGESGTGKTLAAEVIANEAQLDLYRIDLATVVSKYIGETEKNLRRVFDAAEASGAVLLFDEADALFGKRSDVKDSHDRYANIEVAYLLQRVESYRGLAILTSNFRSALDRAFLRRLRFVVQFPFPDEAARERIWRHELPATAPTRDLDFAALARLQLSGGHIRSVVLNAAFMAAGDGVAITMEHLRRAAQRESAKLERSLADAGRWS